MSLILDALRKMEQDRRGRSGPAGVLRPDVLRYRARIGRRKRTTPYLLICGAVVLLTGGIAAGMFALGRHHAVPVAAGPSAVTTSVAEPAPVPVPAPLTSPPAESVPPAPASEQPRLAETPANPVAAAPSPMLAQASQRKAEFPKEPRLAKTKRAGLPLTKPERHDVAEAVQPAPQEITISGIAWQEERNLRRAVLNGTLVSEGAVVAGARVVEIKEDRVRLSRAGQSFEIPFSSALSSR